MSVIVAVRNEAPYIQKCLDALLAQDFERGFELIVVDGNSDDGTRELLEEQSKEGHFTLLHNAKFNAAAGRNLGMEEARGTNFAFVDGDAVPALDWLTQIAERLDRFPRVAGVGGPDRLPPDSPVTATLIGQSMASPLANGGRFNPSTQHNVSSREELVAHIPTCNLCLRRSVIKEVGPFDESFAKGQDFELNFRIAKAGYRLLYCPQVSVFHYRRESLSGLARQVFQWGRARFQLLRRHGLAGLSSYVSAWPIISVSVLALVGLFAILFEHVAGATLALVVGSGVYVLLLLAEALRLATRYKSAMLLVATPLILVIVHGAYFCGFLAGAPRATN